MAEITAYPLAWPPGWPRTKPVDRAFPRFHRVDRAFPRFHRTETRAASWNPETTVRDKKALSIFDAVARVQSELLKFGVEQHTIVISTNVETRQDGLPRSDRRAPDDPGVAVYWKNPDTGKPQCMAIDLYTTVAGNLAAVAATIDAMRAIERHGGAQILNRAFQGFTALPASTTTALSTDGAADVLARRTGRAAAAITTDREVARAAYREAASRAHPDAGGSTTDFQLIHEAKRVLEAHFGGPL